MRKVEGQIARVLVVAAHVVIAFVIQRAVYALGGHDQAAMIALFAYAILLATPILDVPRRLRR